MKLESGACGFEWTSPSLLWSWPSRVHSGACWPLPLGSELGFDWVLGAVRPADLFQPECNRKWPSSWNGVVVEFSIQVRPGMGDLAFWRVGQEGNISSPQSEVSKAWLAGKPHPGKNTAAAVRLQPLGRWKDLIPDHNRENPRGRVRAFLGNGEGISSRSSCSKSSCVGSGNPWWGV